MNFSNENISSSLAAVFGFLFLLILPFDKLLVPLALDAFKSQYLGDSLKNIAIILFGVVVITRSGYTKAAGLRTFKPRNLLLVIVPLYFLLAGPIEYYLLGYEFQNIASSDVAILLISTLTVGFSEEIIFRGFVLPNLIKGAPSGQRLIVPILTSSLMFGVLHFLNLLQADSYFPLVIAQVTYATMFGVGFGIILLRTGSIFPLGILHGLINFSSSWDDLPGAIEPAGVDAFRMQEAILSVLIVLPFLFYMLRQLSKIDRVVLMAIYNR